MARALLGDAAFVARPHVAKGAIKAGHDAIELAAALTGVDVEDGLTRYDAVRRPASALVVAESRRLGAYLEGKGKRTPDPITFMRENGGVEISKQGRRWPVLPTAGENWLGLTMRRRVHCLVGSRLEVNVRVLR